MSVAIQSSIPQLNAGIKSVNHARRAGVGGDAVINGIAIGTEGEAGTLYEGFKLVWGDDFDTLPNMWGGNNTSGKWSASSPQVGSRRVSGGTPTPEAMVYLDPHYRGNRSQSPVALGYQPMSVADGILSMTASPVTAPMADFLPTDYTGSGSSGGKPHLMSAGLRSWPQFIVSSRGDFIITVKSRMPVGVALGDWFSAWTSSFNWPDYQEFDLYESKKEAGGENRYQANIIGSTTDGSPQDNEVLLSNRVVPDRMVEYVFKKHGTTCEIWDDIDAEGTLALEATFTGARVDRFRGGHDVRLDHAVSPGWDSTTFNIAHWPKTGYVAYVMAWTPAAQHDNAAMAELDSVNTTPGGAWTATLPAVTAIYGDTPDREEVYAAFDNYDAPGRPTKANWLPGGMTVNKGTRAVTGTVPTTEGGRTGLLCIGTYDAGGPAKRAIKYFNVAPAVQASLFANQAVETGDPVSLTIAYTDFHSGNLGPHTYVVTETTGGTDFTITGNGTGEVTITGDADTGEVTTLSIACTNSIGQTTTVVRTITAASYEAEAEALFARFTTPPTDTRKGQINTLIAALKTAGVWTKADAIYVEAAADSQAALLNWKSTSYDATLVNAPTFTADRGFLTNGSSSYIDSNFNPTTAVTPNFTQNSASFGLWNRTTGTNTSSGAGWFDGTDGVTMTIASTGTVPAWRLNQAAFSAGAAMASAVGLLMSNRSASNVTALYKNGASNASDTTASAAPNNETLKFGRFSAGGYDARQFAFGWIGGSLTAGERTAVYNAVAAYMTAVGA